jgi:hypothetical protein
MKFTWFFCAPPRPTTAYFTRRGRTGLRLAGVAWRGNAPAVHDDAPCAARSLDAICLVMSTFTEVAVAADALPPEEQRKLLQHIAATLSSAAESPGRSMHELMKDGCGIVDSGVTDLASNKQHLRGYGR